MKYLFIFLLVPLLSLRQKGSYLGVYANTGIYKLYNYNDWHTNEAPEKRENARRTLAGDER